MLTHRRSIPTLAVTFAALAPAAVSAQLPGPAAAAWEEVAGGWHAVLADEGIVGASLALVVDGKAERHEVHGFADLGERRPVDDRTIYHWASITKTLTAISIMQLRDRGLLSLDDPIVDHVPELRDVYNPFGRMEDVTIRQIMSHSAGFRAGTWPWGGDEEWHPHEPTEWSQLVAMIPYTRIHFPPGSRFSYSNPGIIFLGRVIEKLTGDVFETYVDKNVFRPLGMRNAYFDGTPRHLLAHRSNHYFVEEGTSPRAGGPDFDTGITVSNGGLNAPVTDMVRYLGFLMGSPPDDIPDGWSADAVLSRASLEEMWRTVVPIQDTGIGRETMGLSFFLYDNGGTRIVGHTGTQRAFYSFMAFDPVARVGAVGAFNTAGTSGSGPDTHAIRIGTRDAVVNQVFPLVRGGAR